MREALLSTFNKMFVLDLHGDAMSGDKAASGIDDQNVFDITKGVAISIFVRTRSAGAEQDCPGIYSSLWGPRERINLELNAREIKAAGKYDWLAKIMSRASNGSRPALKRHTIPSCLRTRKSGGYRREFVGIDELFRFGSSGFVAGHSEFAVGFTEAEVLNKFQRFVLPENAVSTDDLKAEFGLRDHATWKVVDARTALRSDKKLKRHVVCYLARPFDIRSVMYSDEVLVRAVRRVQRHAARRQSGTAGVTADRRAISACVREQKRRHVQCPRQCRASWAPGHAFPSIRTRSTAAELGGRWGCPRQRSTI